MNNVNISGGKKTRETIQTRKEDAEKNCGRNVREKDKNQHIWNILQINPLKQRIKRIFNAS